MDTKQHRSEFYANIQMQLGQATARQGSNWTTPATVRAVKRTMWLTIKTLLTFWK